MWSFGIISSGSIPDKDGFFYIFSGLYINFAEKYFAFGSTGIVGVFPFKIKGRINAGSFQTDRI